MALRGFHDDTSCCLGCVLASSYCGCHHTVTHICEEGISDEWPWPRVLPGSAVRLRHGAAALQGRQCPARYPWDLWELHPVPDGGRGCLGPDRQGQRWDRLSEACGPLVGNGETRCDC